MSLQKQQTALARLYTDREFQSHFLADPKEFAAELGLTTNEAESLAATAADEVRWFANSLIIKRLREVAKKLPLTSREIGAEVFELKFRRFAAEYSPVSAKKHVEDTLAFADFLVNGEIGAALRRLVRFESRRLRHNALGRMVSLCVLRRDPRNLELVGIGIWIAVKGWSRIYFLVNRGR
jgi:hypothetical protein